MPDSSPSSSSASSASPAAPAAPAPGLLASVRALRDGLLGLAQGYAQLADLLLRQWIGHLALMLLLGLLVGVGVQATAGAGVWALLRSQWRGLRLGQSPGSTP